MLEYKIVKKRSLPRLEFRVNFATILRIAKYRNFGMNICKANSAKEICGTYGICIDNGGCKNFTYLIADDYAPWKEYSGDLEMKYIPEHTYAVFSLQRKIAGIVTNGEY